MYNENLSSNSWTLVDAVKLVKALRMDVSRYGYTMLLGEDLLTRGYDREYLELTFLPNHSTFAYSYKDELLSYLRKIWGQELLAGKKREKEPDQRESDSTSVRISGRASSGAITTSSSSAQAPDRSTIVYHPWTGDRRSTTPATTYGSQQASPVQQPSSPSLLSFAQQYQAELERAAEEERLLRELPTATPESLWGVTTSSSGRFQSGAVEASEHEHVEVLLNDDVQGSDVILSASRLPGDAVEDSAGGVEEESSSGKSGKKQKKPDFQKFVFSRGEDLIHAYIYY